MTDSISLLTSGRLRGGKVSAAILRAACAPPSMIHPPLDFIKQFFASARHIRADSDKYGCRMTDVSREHISKQLCEKIKP